VCYSLRYNAPKLFPAGGLEAEALTSQCLYIIYINDARSSKYQIQSFSKSYRENRNANYMFSYTFFGKYTVCEILWKMWYNQADDNEQYNTMRKTCHLHAP
jgi:hypothetical protein